MSNTSKAPKPARPGAFEKLDRDLVVGKGTKGKPLPHHTRKLGIALVMKGGASRVAHLTPDLCEGFTPNQVKASLQRLQSWPVGDPLIAKIEGNAVHLRPTPEGEGWVMAYRWLYDSKLAWDAKLAIWTIRSGKRWGRGTDTVYAFNVTGRSWPSLADCVSATDRNNRGRQCQLDRAEKLADLLQLEGLVQLVGGYRSPARCRLLDSRQPESDPIVTPWRHTMASHHGVTPCSEPEGVLSHHGVTPCSGQEEAAKGIVLSHHGDPYCHTTADPIVTPRLTLLSHHATVSTPSDPSSTPFFYPVATDQLEDRAPELQLAGRYAAGGGGLRPLARVVEFNGEARPQPCQDDSHSLQPCAAEGHQPQPCQEGSRPATLAACGGSVAPTPAPIAENRDEAKEAPRYDTAKMRAALLKSHGADPTPQPVAAPPEAKRPSTRDRYRAAVEEVEQLSTYNRTAQRTEMSLDKVARFLQSHSKDLPKGWTVSDLHAAFASAEFYGADRLSWGWVISPDVWPRFADVVGKAFASRKAREADRAESVAKAELAAASDDPAQRAKAGSFYCSISVARPLEGIPLLLDALDYPVSAALAARSLGGWASDPSGGDALLALAVGKLREFLEGGEGGGSDAAEDVRWALRLLEYRIAYPPADDEHGELVTAEAEVSDLMLSLVDE